MTEYGYLVVDGNDTMISHQTKRKIAAQYAVILMVILAQTTFTVYLGIRNGWTQAASNLLVLDSVIILYFLISSLMDSRAKDKSR